MNCIIPFEGKSKFDYPVVEIDSISLEHEYTINEHEILGNFLIAGTCKEHKLSINTTEFNFSLPFEVTLPDDINLDTLEFSVDNFTYDLEDNELNVNISYKLTAEDNVRETFNENIIEEILPQEKETVIQEEPKEERNINNNLTNFIDDYATYKIYIVKEEDTIESVSLKYNIDKDELLKINNIDKISVYDKLLIPLDNE